MTKTGWAALARMGGIGDNLMSATALEPLRKLYGKVEVLSQAPQSEVFENNPHIDKLTNIDQPSVPKDMTEWQKYFQGRAKEYDKFCHLSHTCESTRALFPAQTAFYWPASMRRKMCGQSYIETIFDVCELAYEDIGGSVFFPTDQEHEKAEVTKKLIGKSFIAWVISGTRYDKVYPRASETIAQLIRDFMPVVMLGVGTKDFVLAKAIMEDVVAINGSHAGLHLGLSPAETDPPTWPIRRVLTMVQHASIVIGPDTGPMWAVAFETVPKVMLLSHASDENITKRWLNTITLHADQKLTPCWPCHLLHDSPATCVPNREKNGAACISSITPQAIAESTSKLLSAVGEPEKRNRPALVVGQK